MEASRMSLFRMVAVLLVLAGGAWAAGVPVTERDVAPWALDVDPQGRGLPSGAGTVRAGEQV